MLTPQNFREKTFDKAIFGGYDMAAVDDFLDEAANDYSAIAKENMVLKSKMKVLVDKIEEYRTTEDTMRQTLLSAQKLAAGIEAEARGQAEAIARSTSACLSLKVPSISVVIGEGGVERIVEVQFTPEEKAAFDKSCDAVKKLDEGMKGTMADYQIASVAETAIMDIYPYSAEPNDKPEFQG